MWHLRKVMPQRAAQGGGIPARELGYRERPSLAKSEANTEGRLRVSV
jgi:hypothetical protein